MVDTSIDRKKVWKTVLVSWCYTILAFVMTFVVALLIAAVAYRFMGPRALIGVMIPMLAMMLLSFLLSEVIVTTIFRAKKPSFEEYGDFIDVANELFDQKRILSFLRPRLRILDMPVPNAMAFGWGILGQSCIGITPSLYKMMERDELKGIVAHELAHIRCKDVGVMMTVAILTGGVDKIRGLIMSGKTTIRPPFSWIFGGTLKVIGDVIFGFLKSALSQERELAADALGSSYVGSPEPLMRGLQKLAKNQSRKSKERDKQKSIFSDLMISHPRMEERINSLQSIKKPALLEKIN